MQNLLNQVAHHMGPSWQAEMNHDRAGYLIASDGRKILVYHDQHANRLEVSGSYPRDDRNTQYISAYDNPPRITVSMARNPRAIALDISRRFLPAFDAMWQEALKREGEHIAYADARQSNVERLTEAWQGSARHDGDIAVGGITTMGWDGSIAVSADTATLTLHNLPVDAAIEIAGIVHRYGKESK